MKTLNLHTLLENKSTEFFLTGGTERFLQFGEGNFLRGFADYFIDAANEKLGLDNRVVVVQPIEKGLADMINAQDGLYRLYLKGLVDGRKQTESRLISCISRAINPYSEYDAFLQTAENPDLRFIISNTTEAGIVFDESCMLTDAPPKSFPAKLAALLWNRFRFFGDKPGYGFVVLSCELIDDNGRELCRCVKAYAELWELPDAFLTWLEAENVFCNTLVDRIITGYPAAEAEALNAKNKVRDALMNSGELFGFWAIEGPAWLKEALPFEKAGLPATVVPDQSPYKKRKVRILNGAQTAATFAAYLAGFDMEKAYMEDPVCRTYLETLIREEVIPYLGQDTADLHRYADEVIMRLDNPFIAHRLLDITLNAVPKWRARVLPSIKAYREETGVYPPKLTFSFAALLAFYTVTREESGQYFGSRNGQEYPLRDDSYVLAFFAHCKGMHVLELASIACADTRLWGEDLTKLEGFAEQAAVYMDMIQNKGMKAALAEI